MPASPSTRSVVRGQSAEPSGTELLYTALSWTCFTLKLSPQEFTGDSPEKAAARATMAGAQAALKQIEDDEVGWYCFTLSNLSCNHMELSF
jgi:hypothetical protein